MLADPPPFRAWASALIAALVGFGGTIALIVQCMRAMGADVAQTGSAVAALCFGIAFAGAALSLKLRMPVIIAWSTPGAALLAATTPGVSWPVAVGVFISAALMMIALGAVPALGRLAERIPPSVASAMLAGVLLPFCLRVFSVGAIDPLLVVGLVFVFLAARQRAPLYALLLTLAAGVAFTLIRRDLAPIPPGAVFGAVSFTSPVFDAAAIFGIAVPLFLVTLVSQNLPGLVVLRAAGYKPEPRTLLVGTGLTSLAAAPFGAHSVNLAAITAAICTNEDAHPDHAKRWTVGALYAGFYLALGIFSPGLVRLFLALPEAMIQVLTGIALIPALTGAIETMLSAKHDRDAAIVTFLATGSGVAFLGLGSAFWGLLAGFVALGVRAVLKERAR